MDIHFTDLMALTDEVRDRLMKGQDLIPSDRPKELKIGFYDNTKEEYLLITLTNVRRSVEKIPHEKHREYIYQCFQTQEKRFQFFFEI